MPNGLRYSKARNSLIRCEMSRGEMTHSLNLPRWHCHRHGTLPLPYPLMGLYFGMAIIAHSRQAKIVRTHELRAPVTECYFIAGGESFERPSLRLIKYSSWEMVKSFCPNKVGKDGSDGDVELDMTPPL